MVTDAAGHILLIARGASNVVVQAGNTAHCFGDNSQTSIRLIRGFNIGCQYFALRDSRLSFHH